jgi:hypothetical protein
VREGRSAPLARGARHANLVANMERRGRVRVRVRGGGGPKTSAGLRRGGATGSVRTANPVPGPVASELSRCAPPYQYSPRKDPDLLSIRSIYVQNFTSISGDLICVLLTHTECHRSTPGHLLATIKAPPPNQNSPPEDWAGCRAQALRAWPDATCCDGQCQGPQDEPSKTWQVSGLGDAALHAHMVGARYQGRPFQLPELPVALERRVAGLRQIIWGIFG